MPQWTPQQQQAIEAGCGSLLLSAAAGSGKTAVLTERVMHLLTNPENPVDANRLLIVTFTNAAAEEMRTRIMEKLAVLLEQEPQNPLYRRQQVLLGQAAISTVHAFCLNLLKEHYARLDLSPDFRLAEDAMLDNLKEEAVNEVLEDFYQRAEPAFLELVELLSSPRDDRKVLRTIFDLHSFILSHPFPEAWLKEKLELYDEQTPVSESVYGRMILAYAGQALEYASFLTSGSVSAAGQEPVLMKSYLPALQNDEEQIQRLCQTARYAQWEPMREQLRDSSLPLWDAPRENTTRN